MRVYRFFTLDVPRQLRHLVELSWGDRVLAEPQATATLVSIEVIESCLLISPNWPQHLELVSDLMTTLSPKGGWALGRRPGSQALMLVRSRAVLVHLISNLAIIPYFMLSHRDVQLLANAVDSDVERSSRRVQRRAAGLAFWLAAVVCPSPRGFRGSPPCGVVSLALLPILTDCMRFRCGMLHKLPWLWVLGHSKLLVIYWLWHKL